MSSAKISEIQDRSQSIQSRSFEKEPLEAQQLEGGHVSEKLSRLPINNCENRKTRSLGVPRAFPASHF